MREKTTVTVEQADEVVSIIKSLDVESLSTDDQLTVLYAWEYISRTQDIEIIVEAHKRIKHEIMGIYLRLSDKLPSTRGFNDTDELFTALRSLRQTVETT